MDPIIVTESLVKTYGAVRALDGLDLQVAEGSVLGLLGPNGAGKTTAVRVLSTLLRPDGGRALVGGWDVAKDPRKVRQIIGLSGQYAAVDQYLTGRENLVLFARLHRMHRRPAERRADELLERFDLTGVASRLVKTYSGGMRRRLDLAASLIARPRLITLDEPTTGLDPRSRNATWELVTDLVESGTTVLLTTQYLEEADRLAERVVVLDRGRAIAEGTPDELKARVGGEHLEVVTREHADLPAVTEMLAAIGSGEVRVDQQSRTALVPVAEGVPALADVAARLTDQKIAVYDVGLRRVTLDDVFLALTGRDSPAATATTMEEKQ